jgi:hypothetical protein
MLALNLSVAHAALVSLVVGLLYVGVERVVHAFQRHYQEAVHAQLLHDYQEELRARLERGWAPGGGGGQREQWQQFVGGQGLPMWVVPSYAPGGAFLANVC